MRNGADGANDQVQIEVAATASQILPPPPKILGPTMYQQLQNLQLPGLQLRILIRAPPPMFDPGFRPIYSSTSILIEVSTAAKTIIVEGGYKFMDLSSTPSQPSQSSR